MNSSHKKTKQNPTNNKAEQRQLQFFIFHFICRKKKRNYIAYHGVYPSSPTQLFFGMPTSRQLLGYFSFKQEKSIQDIFLLIACFECGGKKKGSIIPSLITCAAVSLETVQNSLMMLKDFRLFLFTFNLATYVYCLFNFITLYCIKFTLNLNSCSGWYCLVLGNLLQVSLLEEGVRPDVFHRSLLTSTILFYGSQVTAWGAKHFMKG